MCLIIEKPAGIDVPAWIVESALAHNEDGVGIMTAGRAERFLKIAPEKLVARINSLQTDAAIHFRMATHGTITTDNVHPFKVKGGSYLMHNGILSKYAPSKGTAEPVSDTRIFVERFVNPMVEKHGKVLPDAIAKEATGQAILTMDRTGELIRIGTSWIKYQELHFSNTYAWDAPDSICTWKSYKYGSTAKRASVWDGYSDVGESAGYTYGTSDRPSLLAGVLEDDNADIRAVMIDDILMVQDYIDWQGRTVARGVSRNDAVDISSGIVDLESWLYACTVGELLAVYRAACEVTS